MSKKQGSSTALSRGAAASYVRVLEGNPILVRALEREMREAESRVERTISHDVRDLTEGIAGQPPGEGPHLARIATARKLLDEAAANYLAVKAELEHARNPKPTDEAGTTMAWTFAANDHPDATKERKPRSRSLRCQEDKR